MRVAFLVPDPDYPAEWRWAYDPQATALTKIGVEVEPVPWTHQNDFSNYDLILPLVAWGYHKRYADWRRFLDRMEQELLPVINPVPLLRWNSDKAYLAELGKIGTPTVPTLAVASLDERALDAARVRFGCS